MTHQTTMFDQVTDAYGNVNVVSTPIARKADPETSKKAAASVAPKLTGLRAKFVEGVRLCGGKATSMEAADAVSVTWGIRESIRKRAKECVDAGAVRVSGTRKCKVSGNECSVYEIVE